MKFYHVKDEYIDYLKKFDKMVYDNKNESRTYVGTIIEVEGLNIMLLSHHQNPNIKK